MASFELDIDGTIINEKCIEGIRYQMDLPYDAGAKSDGIYCTLIISGRIFSPASMIDGTGFDNTTELGDWAKTPIEGAKVYRTVTAKVLSEGLTARQYVFKSAFVVDYNERYADASGDGTFVLVIREKKNNLEGVEITGLF